MSKQLRKQSIDDEKAIMYNNIMEQPKNIQPTKICKTWFIERGDGKVFACDEPEAWNLMRNKSNWQRSDFKIIGVSDGQTYATALKDASKEKATIDNLIANKSTELTRYLTTLDKFKFDELLEDTNEKVIKVKGIIDGIQKEIDDLHTKFAKGFQDVVDKAFNAELDKARGNIEMPRNQDIMTPNGDRDLIMRNMPNR